MVHHAFPAPHGRRPLVVIVGSGPTGLAAALELGMRGISCLIIERNERVGYAPRAKTTHVRTRELMRRWGIAEALAKVSPFGLDHPNDVHFITRMNGRPLVRFKDALTFSPKRDDRYSEHGQWVPQYKLEAVLRERALELDGVSLEYGTEFVSFEQDEETIRVTVRAVATGETRVIAADYLIGADGARSAVRDAVGAKMEGRYGLSTHYNIIFHAPGLAEAHPHGPGVMYWQINTDQPSLLGPMDEGDLWYFMPTSVPPSGTLTDDEALALIKRSTGIDLPYRILSSDMWVASRLLADRYRLGRAFLAGDACHLHPPFGGFGMNMGVADGADIGWKLAAELQGWGGPALLDSYEIERRPVHNLVMDEAESNHSVLSNHLFREGVEEDGPRGDQIRAEVSDLIRETKAREFYALGVVKGLRYRGSPVIANDGTEEDWVMSRDYVPSAAPGSIAPHGWIDDETSLYDLFGPGFTLLAFEGAGDADIAAAEAEATRTETPLKIVRIADPQIAARYEARLALVRPDQHVAWRGDSWPDTGLLTLATGRAAAESRAKADPVGALSA